MLRYALLGLLAHQPRHGYDLKYELEKALGGNWEVNFGQIYTTLSRLERDNLIATGEEVEDGRGKKTYAITSPGRKELETWLAQTVEKVGPLRDEFFIKLIVQHLAGYGNTLTAITQQRQAYLQQLRGLTELVANKSDDPFVSLLIEGAILHLQADLHWLDLCDERLEQLDQKT